MALGLGTAGPTVMYGLVAGILSPLPAAEPHEIVDVSLIDATAPLRMNAESGYCVVRGHTVPWCGAVTGARPLYTNFCTRFPSHVSVV